VHNAGDLVQVSEDCALRYFAGKIAIVVSSLGQDYTMTNESGYHHDFDISEDIDPSYYYSLLFSTGHQHVFSHKEIKVLSKAEIKSNENR
jgi:hypothetical protein